MYDNEEYEDRVDTEFYIERCFGDRKNGNCEKLDESNKVVPITPTSTPDEKFHFKISSNHENEYVNLESCKLKLKEWLKMVIKKLG